MVMDHWVGQGEVSGDLKASGANTWLTGGTCMKTGSFKGVEGAWREFMNNVLNLV